MIDDGPFELGPLWGGGPAVLCLHGLTGTPYEVRPLGEALSREGFACLGPVLPGHRESWRALASTPRGAWVAAAEAAHERLASKHERVYALGLSLGGLLALDLCASRHVSGAVLLAAPLRFEWSVRALVPLLARWLPSLPKTPAIRDREARARHPGYDRMPLAAVRELLRFQSEVRARLPLVHAPLCLVYSRRDPTVHPANAELIRSSVSSARCEVHWVEESEHVLPVDVDGEAVARACVEFLCDLEAKSAAIDDRR